MIIVNNIFSGKVVKKKKNNNNIIKAEFFGFYNEKCQGHQRTGKYKKTPLG